MNVLLFSCRLCLRCLLCLVPSVLIYLQSLTPPSFWDKLGFGPDTVFLTDTEITAGLDPYTLFTQCTTGQYVGADAVRDKIVSSVPILSEGAGFQQFGLSDISTEIVPTDTYQADRVGYYLLETIANFQTDFRTTTETKGTVTSIMSKQYNNADFITVYGDSSVPYEHMGQAVALSSIHVRILEPTTGLPVDFLGSANVVFLEIVRSSSSQNIEVKSTKDGHTEKN